MRTSRNRAHRCGKVGAHRIVHCEELLVSIVEV